MGVYLSCRVSRGLFSDERAVSGRDFRGVEFSLFVPEEVVESANLQGDESVDGWLKVEILDEQGGLLLVRLPGQAFENGRTLTVSRSQVEERRPREIA
jgi:hypothetical protein